MRRPTILDQIRALDPERDHQRIVFLSTCYEFPFDTTRALEFALFRTFCVPRIARLLDGTGEFRKRAAEALRRYRHHRQRADGARLRQRARQPRARAHERAAWPLQDRATTISATSSRPSSTSRSAGTHASAGARCARPSGSPFSTSGAQSASAWGSRTFRPTTPPSNATTSTTRPGISATPMPAGRVGAATIEMFASWFPRFLRPLVRRSMYAIMDDPVIDGLRLPETVAGDARLRDRGAAAAGAAAPLLPARRHPRCAPRCPPLLSRRLPYRGAGAAVHGSDTARRPIISPIDRSSAPWEARLGQILQLIRRSVAYKFRMQVLAQIAQNAAESC